MKDDHPVKCPDCGKNIRTYVPAGGDGSAVRVYGHKDMRDRLPCSGSHALVNSQGKRL